MFDFLKKKEKTLPNTAEEEIDNFTAEELEEAIDNERDPEYEALLKENLILKDKIAKQAEEIAYYKQCIDFQKLPEEDITRFKTSKQWKGMVLQNLECKKRAKMLERKVKDLRKTIYKLQKRHHSTIEASQELV